MHTAWLIGDVPQTLLDDLTARDGYPPAEVWVPIDSIARNNRNQRPKYRSAWAYRTTDNRQWLDVALPAETIIEVIGPQALAHPKTLTQIAVLATNTETRDGVLTAKVPPYFTTVATSWTLTQGDQKPLALKRRAQAFTATVGDLDFRKYSSYNTRENAPHLFIGPDGPLLLTDHDWGSARYYNVSGSKEASRVSLLSRSSRPRPPSAVPATPYRSSPCTSKASSSATTRRTSWTP